MDCLKYLILLTRFNGFELTDALLFGYVIGHQMIMCPHSSSWACSVMVPYPIIKLLSSKFSHRNLSV